MEQNNTKADSTKADFCIEIDFEKGTESPSRVFRTMSELIESFEEFDKELVRCIDPKIETIAIIEDIETGSIKAWLSYILKSIDDSALKDLDWKPAVGKYLVKAKYYVIDFIEKKTKITSKAEIEELERTLLKSAEETNVKHLPSYYPINRSKLLSNLGNVSSALKYLKEKDTAIYITKENKVTINAQFNFVPEQIEDLITEENIESTIIMILKVKKPDYLSESQWEFRHESHIIYAKIIDIKWLKKFQSRQQDVRPGDSIRAKVKINVKYGYDKEVVSTHHEIMEVIEIIPFQQGEQIRLTPPKDLD